MEAVKFKSEDMDVSVESIYARVKSVIPAIEWASFVDDVKAILRLKKERNAVILAHNYMRPEIFHCVADLKGDSLALARDATRIDADVILVAGVHFMAETAKLLNPSRKVLIPDMEAGCSLAEAVTAEDVRAMRKRYPDVPIITYVNTSAAVKAEADICCTSGNAKKIVESLGVPRVIMMPDRYLAQNVANETGVEIIAWQGRCEVHERFTSEDIKLFREQNPGVVVLAHPECTPEIVAASDYSGSTAGMIDWVGKNKPSRAVLLTECSMSDNVAVDNPDTEFVRPCQMCPYMKRITLANIRSALENMEHEVNIPEEITPAARRSVERMIEVK